MRKSFQFRLYPSSSQQEELFSIFKFLRSFYNSSLEERISSYKYNLTLQDKLGLKSIKKPKKSTRNSYKKIARKHYIKSHKKISRRTLKKNNVFNITKNKTLKLYNNLKSTSDYYSQAKLLPEIKELFPQECGKIHSQTIQYVLIQLDSAYKNFFKNI